MREDSAVFSTLCIKIHRFADMLFHGDLLWSYDCVKEAVEQKQPMSLTLVGSPLVGAVIAEAAMTNPVSPSCPVSSAACISHQLSSQ